MTTLAKRKKYKKPLPVRRRSPKGVSVRKTGERGRHPRIVIDAHEVMNSLPTNTLYVYIRVALDIVCEKATVAREILSLLRLRMSRRHLGDLAPAFGSACAEERRIEVGQKLPALQSQSLPHLVGQFEVQRSAIGAYIELDHIVVAVIDHVDHTRAIRTQRFLKIGG